MPITSVTLPPLFMNSSDNKMRTDRASSINPLINTLTRSVKMVYGFATDIAQFKKQYTLSFSLRDLNYLINISSEAIDYSTESLLEDIKNGNLKINNGYLNQLSERSGISTDCLLTLSQHWMLFLGTHIDELSVSRCLNEKGKKADNAFIDFIRKNNRIDQSRFKNTEGISEQIKRKPFILKEMYAIYTAFIESDSAGYEALKEIASNHNLAYQLFKGAISTHLSRKLSKLGMSMSFSFKNSPYEFIFIKPKIINNILFIAASNEDNWKGKHDFDGIENAYEPLTYSEMRYATRNGFPVCYLTPIAGLAAVVSGTPLPTIDND